MQKTYLRCSLFPPSMDALTLLTAGYLWSIVCAGRWSNEYDNWSERYDFMENAKQWVESNEACSMRDGQLATLDEEHAGYITDMMRKHDAHLMWLGGHAQRMGWQWVNMDAEEAQNSASKMALTLGDTFPACIALDSKESWEVTPCGFERGYVCERSKSDKQCESTRLKCGKGVNEQKCKEKNNISKTQFPYNGMCLEFHSHTLQWYDANNACQDRRAYSQLAVIATDDKLQAVQAFLQKGNKKKSKKYWVGMSNHKWVWMDGRAVIRATWGTNQPNLSGECIALQRNNMTVTLTNRNCEERLPSVCVLPDIEDSTMEATTEQDKKKKHKNGFVEFFSFLDVKNLNHLTVCLRFALLGGLIVGMACCCPLGGIAHYYKRKIRKLQGYIDALNKLEPMETNTTNTIQAHEMPYPYNHIYSEAQVPPLPMGRPPSGPPPSIPGNAVYSTQVTTSSTVASSVKPRIATFANGVYNTEDSTIYSQRPQTAGYEEPNNKAQYDRINSQQSLPQEDVYSSPYNTLPGHT